MPRPDRNRLSAALAAVLGAATLSLLAVAGAAAAPQLLGIGTPVSPAEIAPWDIDASPGNGNLPPGRGSVAEGKAVYAQTCAACHGDKGEGRPPSYPALAGGIGTLDKAKPVRTVGSYWPYAETIFDYVHRAMPFNAPQSLTADQTYAVTAWLLNLNGLLPDDAVLDAKSLAAIRMPNRDGFTGDPRPDVKAR